MTLRARLVAVLATLVLAGGLPAATLAPFYPNEPLFFYNPGEPLLPGQWNLVNQAPGTFVYPCFTTLTGRVRAEAVITNAGWDMALSNAWRLGYTGAGVVVGVLDDGVELTHPDLSVRADLSMGFDSNSLVAGQTGAPVRPGDDPHGTCVAGSIAAVGGNGIGICGPAPGAAIASLRVNFTGMDDYFVHAPGYYWQAGLGWTSGMAAAQLGALTNLLESPAIALKNCSSRTLPFTYTADFGDHQSAFARMAANGVIQTLAAGNCRESRIQDSAVYAELCNPYGIPVAAMGSDGRYALYSSFGAPVMACTLSESSYWNPQEDPAKTNFANGLGVYATDVTGTNGANYHSDTTVYLPDLADRDYTAQFDGTSSAAPLLAGLLALARQACPILGPRLAKHLLARTCRQADPDDASTSCTWTVTSTTYSGWLTNAAGFRFNPDYGFGLADATALVTNALRAAYVTRESFHSTGLRTVAASNQVIETANPTGKTESVALAVPAGLKQGLESVEAYVKLTGGDRGEWQIVLNSPAGMSSRLYAPSAFTGSPSFFFVDPCITGGLDRVLLSQAFWGEDPDGVWSLNVANPGGTNPATWHAFGLVLHMGALAFETPGDTVVTQALEIRGLALDQADTRLAIGTGGVIRTCGDVWVNAGTLQVDGTLAKGGTVTVSRLDTTLARVTEDLVYARGVRADVAGGLLAGAGILELPAGADARGGLFNTSGTVRAGDTNGAGTLTVLGNYTQGPDGVLEVYVAGSNASGRLAVSGTASLGGRLRILTPDGLGVGPGWRLPGVISAGAVLGGFAALEARIPAAQSNLYWTVVTNAGGLDLVARPLFTNAAAQLAAAITNLMAEQGVMGLSVALVDDQETVWAAGFGYADREGGDVPATSNTVYRIASVSKAFTSLLAMRAIEGGPATLDTPLTNVVPAFSLLPRFTNTAPITLRTLMNHQSGMPGDTYNGSDTRDRFTPYAAYNAWLFGYLAGDEPVLPPDQIGVYCNNGFVLLAEAVETLAGAPFPGHAEAALFGPLGMTRTSYLKDKAAISNELARPYAGGEAMPEEFVNCLGTGGMYASAPDLALAIKMLLAGGNSPAGRILQAASIDAMAEPQGTNLPLNVGPTRFGLGFDSVQEPALEYAGRVCWKNGNSPFYSAIIGAALDQKVGVAMACNSPANLDDLLRLALQAAILEKAGLAAPTNPYVPPASPVVSLPQADLDTLAGVYAGNSGYHTVAAQPGALTVTLQAHTASPQVLSNLVPRANGMFSEAGSQSNQVAFTNLAGHAVAVQHRAAGTYESRVLLGERCPAVPVPAAWSNRFGRTHLACDVVPNDLYWLTPSTLTLALRRQEGLPMVVALGKPHVIEPQNDTLAFVRELPSRADSSLRAIPSGSGELLRFGGYHWQDLAALPELAVNTGASGQVALTNGIAWYRFTAEAGRRYTVRVVPGGAAPFIPCILAGDLGGVLAAGASNDLTWTCTTNGAYYLGLHTTTPQPYSVRLFRPVTANTHDFDGDGASDLAVYDRIYGYWYARRLDGANLVWARPWGGLNLQPVSADYNGDGLADLAVYWALQTDWYAQGADSTVILWGEPWGGTGFAPVSGDFDGDGAADLAVYHEATGLWFVRSAAGTVVIWALPWGGTGLSPVSGDFDGDSRSDFAVYRPSGGDWYVLGADGTVLAWLLYWGGAGFTPVSGDFDGDGAFDLAVYAESVGMWYVLSLRLGLLAWNTGWGGPGLQAVDGDFDGDGRSDFTVYDQNTGAWYILSPAGATLGWALMWGGPGLAPVGGAPGGE